MTPVMFIVLAKINFALHILAIAIMVVEQDALVVLPICYKHFVALWPRQVNLYKLPMYFGLVVVVVKQILSTLLCTALLVYSIINNF
jgi:hypothetical protein